MQDFHKLMFWERAHALTLDIYKVTREQFPKEEVYGQTSQIRRAVSSIPTNIAEGCGRRSKVEFANFLNIAAGSTSEVEYETLLARDTGYITEEQFLHWTKEAKELRSMINNYMESLRQDAADGSKKV